MREVKVPDFMQPFEVIVNGVKYVFPAGATVTVEDYIADIIEQSVPKEPPKVETKVERVMWEDIGNKPFGEEAVLGDTLYWDGNTEGLESFELNEITYYKVSEIVPTLAEICAGGAITGTDGNDPMTLEFTADHVDANELLTYIFISPHKALQMMVVNEAGHTGIYFSSSEGVYICALKINGYNGFPATVVKPLDEKYMPVLTSPNGTRFKISVGNDGSLSAAEV